MEYDNINWRATYQIIRYSKKSTKATFADIINAINRDNRDLEFADYGSAISHLSHMNFVYIEKIDGIDYIYLSDEGQKLKDLGSFEKYYEDKAKRDQLLNKKEELERILLENHVFLTSDQRKTDRRNRKITMAIAISSTLFALGSLIVSVVALRQPAQKILLIEKETSTQLPSAVDDTLNIQDSSSNKAAVYHGTVESRHTKTTTGLR